jgi:hypothetical protein
MIQKGYFVIVDITGYTAFMTGSELDHAQDILKTLFDTLHDNMKPPLTISNYQGDAILSYTLDGSFLQGQTFLEAVENLYCGFALKLENMQRHTTCTCRACSNMDKLDLKAFIHHGEYVMQDMRGKQELSGSDVIVVHRMTKNKVKEQTSVKAYALFTKAALEAMGMIEFADAEMTPHVENYEHIGDVGMYVYDLRKVLVREREKRRIVVSPTKDAWVMTHADVPVPPSVLWDYISEPEHFRRWCHADALSVTGRKNGRMDVGGTHHCAHGKEQITQTVVDWRPFEYMTLDCTLPMNGMMRYSFHLLPIEGGTRVTCVMSLKTMWWSNKVKTFLMQTMMASTKSQMLKRTQAGCDTIRDMVEADLKAGKLALAPEAAVA